MANQGQLSILKQGAQTWNIWRSNHPDLNIDLTQADLLGTDLFHVNLSRANLGGARLVGARLQRANLIGSVLSHADLTGADLSWSDLTGACLTCATLDHANLSLSNLSNAQLTSANLNVSDLSNAYLACADLSLASLMFVYAIEANFRNAKLNKALLSGAILRNAVFKDADLTEADFSLAQLVGTSFEEANLVGCNVYGVAVWNADLRRARQEDLVISADGEPRITVDNLEVAQFMYLMLNNSKIRDVIDTVAKKIVLVLGRFTPERKAMLDWIRAMLRCEDYVPVMFDFPKPDSRDFTETIRLLAHMSLLIIVDITEAKSVPQELQAIIPNLSVPVIPIVDQTDGPWGMFEDFRKYPWVLAEYRYAEANQLLDDLKSKLIPEALSLKNIKMP